MLLTNTVKLINSDLVPVMLGIISAGIVAKVIMKGIKAQEDGTPLSDFLKQAKKLIWAGIISIVMTGLVSAVQYYYM